MSHAGPASQLPTPPVPVVFRAGPAPLVFHAGPAPQPPTPPPASTSGSETCKMTVSETFHSTSSLLCCSVNFYFIIFYCQFCHSFYVFSCLFSIKLCACSFHIISVSINNFFISPFPFTGNCNVMLCFIQCHSFSQFLSCTWSYRCCSSSGHITSETFSLFCYSKSKHWWMYGTVTRWWDHWTFQVVMQTKNSRVLMPAQNSDALVFFFFSYAFHEP